MRDRFNPFAKVAQIYSEKELKDTKFMASEAAKAGVAVAKENFAGALMTHLHFKELVKRLQRGERLLPMEFEYERGDLPAYKHHALRGRLLHWAVWQAVCKEQGLRELRLVLEAKAAIDSTATYERHNRKTGAMELVQLQAVHLAAGWGSTAALQALADSVAPEARSTLVNCFCKKDSAKYYTPLHDAAFCGQKEAVVWLLEHGADPKAQNIEGFTPLHWLAFTGLEPPSDLEVVVRSLIKYQARLDEKTEPNNSLGIEGIPMEIAAMPASNFPNFLMYLLAPSFQAFEVTATTKMESQPSNMKHMRRRSVFEDLALLCRRNHQAAVAFAGEIVGSSATELRQKVMYDSQLPQTADQLATVFRAAPQAAGQIFSMLVSDPHVHSKGHHPISTRANMRRWMCEHEMICDYQTDIAGSKSERHSEGLPVLPVWDCIGSGYPQWHDLFIRQSKGVGDVEVTTKVVVMPNILTLDLLLAFAEVPDEHLPVVGDVPIKGTINCLWQKLIWPAYYILIILNIIDWIAMFAWGWATTDEALSQVSLGLDYMGDRTSTATSPLDRPAFWTLIMAGLLRDVCNTTWYTVSGLRYRRRVSKQTGDLMSLGTQIWHLPSEFLYWALRLTFLFKTWTLEDRLMTSDQQAWLGAVFLAQCANLLVCFRVTSASGKRILSIIRTLSSRTMVEMMVVMALVFMSILTALVMVHRSQSAVWVATLAYVGLSFGEGDALAEFGLHPDKFKETPLLECLIVFFGGIVFNIVLLNLLIALFANEYDKVEKVSDNHFNRERSRTCCWCLLALQKVRLAEGGGSLRSWLPRIAGLVSLTTGVVLQVFVPSAEGRSPRLILCCTSAACFAFGQVALLAQLLQSEWFVEREDGKVGPLKDHFLWICHRADMERRSHGDTAQLEGRIQDIVARELASALRGVHVAQYEQEKLASKVDALLENNAKLDALMSHLGVVVQPPQPAGGDAAALEGHRSSPPAAPSPLLQNSPVFAAALQFKGKLRNSRMSRSIPVDDEAVDVPLIQTTPPQASPGDPRLTTATPQEDQDEHGGVGSSAPRLGGARKVTKRRLGAKD